MFQISGKRPRMISDYMFVRKKNESRRERGYMYPIKWKYIDGKEKERREYEMRNMEI